jgi:predicted peptidase
VTTPGWAPSPFDPGRLLPSPQSGDAELRRELDRCGLTAGEFEQCSQELHPAGTNRLPWLLIAPTNAAPGARLPLVFFCPVNGEFGPDLRRPFRQPDFQARHPCFLLAILPEKGRMTDLCGSIPGGRPTPYQCTMIDALLAVARSQTGPFVDEDRIVGVGLISGSNEPIGLARNFPRFFSALAPADRAWESDELWDGLLSQRRPAPRERRILRSPSAASGWFFELVR